jgi:hypothetical protein
MTNWRETATRAPVRGFRALRYPAAERDDRDRSRRPRLFGAILDER